jgi:hypothetical protein
MQVKFALSRGVTHATFDANKGPLLSWLASLIAVPVSQLQLVIFTNVPEEALQSHDSMESLALADNVPIELLVSLLSPANNLTTRAALVDKLNGAAAKASSQGQSYSEPFTVVAAHEAGTSAAGANMWDVEGPKDTVGSPGMNYATLAGTAEGTSAGTPPSTSAGTPAGPANAPGAVGSNSSAAMIVGIVAGVAVGLTLLVGVAIVAKRSRHRAERESLTRSLLEGALREATTSQK